MANKRVKAGSSKASAATRRKLFIEAYCSNGRNGKQAAIAAGFSAKTAEQQASRLLRHVKVKEAIKWRTAQAIAAAEENTLLTAEEVMRDLADAMRFDPALLYGPDGALKPVAQMPIELRKHLEGVEVDVVKIGKKARLVTSKVRFAKKSVTREQAMKHFGLYEKDNRQRPELPPIIVKFV